MDRRIILKGRRKPNKNMEKLIAKATKEMQDETGRQYIMVHSAMAIALYQFWNYRKEQIDKIYSTCEKVWEECGADETMSMIRKCDEECDIELTNQEGVSYRQIAWLNDSEFTRPLNDYEFLTFRINQKKWAKAQMMASVCLSVNRSENWGFNRLSELMIRIDDIMADMDYNPDRICMAAHEMTGCDYVVLEVI